MRPGKTKIFKVYIFKPFYITMLCLLVANAQPLSCKEDAHCSEGYFCETQANICQACLECRNLKRLSPNLPVTNECITTINRCGPCAEGFVNIYGNGIKGKCVEPEFFEFGRRPHYAYVCMAAAVIGLLIVATFMYVIKHTDVYRVLAYYYPVSGSPLASGDEASVPNMTSPRHLLSIFLLCFDKNPSYK